MAVAPLTITARRDQAIDFSTPFMNTGVSIMMKKLNKEVKLKLKNSFNS